MGKRSDVRMFDVGDLCIHKSAICRVDAVTRNITGTESYPSLAYMGVKDGTEFNPTLTLTPLYGPDGEPVKRAKSRQASSGAVASVAESRRDIEQQVTLLQKRLALLTR